MKSKAGAAPPRAAAGRGSRSRLHAAERWFFPAAALYGAVAVPLSVYGMRHAAHPLAAFASPAGHAHELLFGYALAVAAGFLVHNVGVGRLSLLFGLWLTARVSYVLWPDGAVATGANLGFALLLGATVAPGMLKGAKKLRNRALGPAVLALVAALVLFHGAWLGKSGMLTHLALREAVLLFALLLAFMGGRILAPAVVAVREGAGERPHTRLQPRMEGALLILVTAAMVAAGVPGAGPLAGVALTGAGVVAAMRLWRWRVWQCRRRPDLLCLAAGYAWLAAGLCLLGGAWILGGVGFTAALHAVTVGALGTLTTSVMVRVRALRTKRDPAAIGALPVAVVLISAAACLRIGAGGSELWLWLAALCWSAGLSISTVVLLGMSRAGRSIVRA